jgi:hypothetical protein
MADRRVTKTGKGIGSVITRLCNPGEYWSPRNKDDAIQDIDNGTHTYYVNVGGNRVDVHVVKMNGSKHLRTDPDGKGKNNLEELPDC